MRLNGSMDGLSSEREIKVAGGAVMRESGWEHASMGGLQKGSS